MKHVFILLIAAVTFSCSEKEQELKRSSIEINKHRNRTDRVSSDTTITVYFDAYSNPYEILFDSSFMVKGITVSYNGSTGDSRMFIVQFSDSLHSSVISSDTTGFAFEQSIFGFLRNSDSIEFTNLNKRTNSLLVWGQSYPENEFKFEVIGRYSEEDGNEVVSIAMDDENNERFLELNSEYNIKSVTAQYYGSYYNQFSILNNDSSIEIYDSASVHNESQTIANEYSESLLFNTEYHVPSSNDDHGFWFFTLTIEK